MHKNAPKVITLRVSVNAIDERTMEEFASDIKESLAEQAANVTFLSEYYLLDGQPVRPDGTHVITGKEWGEKKESKKRTEKAKTKSEQKPPEQEPPAKTEEVAQLAKKVAPKKISMKKEN